MAVSILTAYLLYVTCQEFNWKKDEMIVRGSRCHIAENSAGIALIFICILRKVYIVFNFLTLMYSVVLPNTSLLSISH